MGFSARDAALAPLSQLLPAPTIETRGALARAIRWLCRSHEVTGRHGSSKGFSLLHGWLPAYPETTGYVIGTLLQYAAREGNRPDLIKHAQLMGEWETRMQQPDGGVMLGHAETQPRRSVVFNTGMVLHGWVDLIESGISDERAPGERAVAFLIKNLRSDGTWRPEVEYNDIPHTYNSRVSWGMLRWAALTGDDEVRSAARRQLDWVLSRRRANGWFDDCVFKPGTAPSTHAIAYTLRGLLEGHAMLDDPRYLDAVVGTSEVMIKKLEVLGRLPANWASNWSPTVCYECVTGNAQLGGVWLRLFQITGDARYLNAGLKAVDLALARQVRSRSVDLDGALPGSFPLWGRYAPLQYPNWAAKFLADAMMIREDALESLQ